MVAKAKSSDAVFQTLAWARRLKFKPVPLRPGSKAAHIGDYVDPDYQPPPDDFWRQGKYGVGIVTGPAHSGPIDIDLDTKEALFFAPRFLPTTPAVFGHKSKPRSHYLYRVDVDALPKSACIDPVSNDTIIEIRGDGGHQTVFPGSIHEGTRELIEWADNPLPNVPTVDVEELIRNVHKVAAASLFAKHAWHEGQRNEVVKHLSGMLFYYGWPPAEALDFIDAICAYASDRDRTRLITVRATYKRGEATGKVTAGPTMKELLGDDRLVQRLNDWFGSPHQSIIEDYNARYAVVALGGKYRIAEMTVDSLSHLRYIFMTRDDFVGLTANDTVASDKGLIPKARIWLAASQRRQYMGVCFRPGDDDTDPLLNLWPGWAVEPKKGDCSAWIELGKKVICGGDDELWDWLFSWLTNIVKDPRKKPLTAPVLRGEQGAGKTLFISYFGKILGSAYTAVTHDEHIHGKFNVHLSHTLLLHSEEALYAGERRHRSVIKSLITDQFRIIEPKGIDPYPIENHLRLIMASNETWAAAVERGDRRYTIIEMERRLIDDKLLKRVLKEYKGGGPAALLERMQRTKYDFETIRTNIKGIDHLEMAVINLDPISEWWYDVLCVGQMFPEAQRWAQSGDELWPQILGTTTLYHRCITDLKARGLRFIPSRPMFARELDRMVGIRLKRKQMWFIATTDDNAGERQRAIIDMPSLEDCRKAFEEYVRQPIEWTEDEGERPPHDKY